MPTVPTDTTTRRGEGLSGRIWETGKPLIVPDCALWEGRSARWGGYLRHSTAVGVPVRLGDEFLGVINVFADPPRIFTPEDAEFLSLIAATAAVAIHNAQLYEQAQQEITERKQAEEALRESEEKYRQLVEASPDAIFVNCEGKIVFVNQAGARLYGATGPEQLIGMPSLDFVHPDYRQIVTERIRQVEQGKAAPPLEMKIIPLDGSLLDMESRAIPFNYQGKPASQAVSRDITDRKQAQEQTLSANERLSYLLSATSAVIYTARAWGNYGATFISGNVSRVVGYEPQEFLEESSFWIDHVHPGDVPRVLSELPKIFDQEYYASEYRFQHRDGAYVWVRDEMKLVRDSKGQ